MLQTVKTAKNCKCKKDKKKPCQCKQKKNPCACDCTDSRCSICPNCFNLSDERLSNIISALDEAAISYGDSVVCKDEWGYGCTPFNLEDSAKVETLKDLIQRYQKSQRDGYFLGICPEEIQEVLEAADMLAGTSKAKAEEVSIDLSGMDEWTHSNPYCVPYESWERATLTILPKIGIEVTVPENFCKILYELKTSVTDIDYKFLYNLEVATKEYHGVTYDAVVTTAMIKGLQFHAIVEEVECNWEVFPEISEIVCNTDFKIDISEIVCREFDVKIQSTLIQCYNEYEIIIKENPKCNLEFKTYLKLLNCKLSSQVVSNLLSCGLTLGYSVEEQSPTISKSGKTLRLEDVNIDLKSKV